MSATSLGPVCSICRDSSNLLEPGRSSVRSQIPLRYPGRRQVRGWSQTCRRPVADLLARASSLGQIPARCRSATSFGPVCDQDSVMEFGFNWAHYPTPSAFSINSLRRCCCCTLTTHCNKSRDPVDRLETLRRCRKLRPALQRLSNC